MVQIDPTVNPFIDREYKSFIKYLADSGIFEKQLDAWAYAAAYAIKNNLQANDDVGRSEMTELAFLDEETLNCLVMALAAVQPDASTMEFSTIVAELSKLASAGIAELHQHLEGCGRNDSYEFLLAQT